MAKAEKNCRSDVFSSASGYQIDSDGPSGPTPCDAMPDRSSHNADEAETPPEATADSREVKDKGDITTEVLAELEAEGDAEPDRATKRKLDDLTAETEALMNEMETKGE